MASTSRRKGAAAWVYTLSIVLAVLVGLIIGIVSGMQLHVPGIDIYGRYASIVLVLFGIALGFLNVDKNEQHGFLLAGVGLVVINSFVQAIVKGFFAFGPLDEILSSLLSSLLFLFVPATLVVALKSLFSLSRA